MIVLDLLLLIQSSLVQTIDDTSCSLCFSELSLKKETLKSAFAVKKNLFSPFSGTLTYEVHRNRMENRRV